MTADREEWSELPMGATTATRTRSGTSVTGRSSVPPRAWIRSTPNWCNQRQVRVAMSEAATSWRFVVVEPNRMNRYFCLRHNRMNSYICHRHNRMNSYICHRHNRMNSYICHSTLSFYFTLGRKHCDCLHLTCKAHLIIDNRSFSWITSIT